MKGISNKILRDLRYMALILLTILALVGCNNVVIGDAKKTQETIELGEVEQANVNIDIAVGELTLTGGSKELLEVNYSEDLKPELSYEIKEKKGYLSLEQSATVKLPILHVGENHFEWDVQLTNEVPIELNVNLGVGESELVFKDIILNELKVDLGIGETTIDL
jgi:hypothetical protein